MGEAAGYRELIFGGRAHPRARTKVANASPVASGAHINLDDIDAVLAESGVDLNEADVTTEAGGAGHVAVEQYVQGEEV